MAFNECLEDLVVKGEMLLEFCDAVNLAVANTWFKKGDSNLFTSMVVVRQQLNIV